jgi:hypothetical protein
VSEKKTIFVQAECRIEEFKFTNVRSCDCFLYRSTRRFRRIHSASTSHASRNATIAREIARERPDIVGLREASILQIGATAGLWPSDHAGLAMMPRIPGGEIRTGKDNVAGYGAACRDRQIRFRAAAAQPEG